MRGLKMEYGCAAVIISADAAFVSSQPI